MNRERIIRFIATLLLVVMCVQYLPLEGYGVSYVKVGIMALTPLFWLILSPNFVKVHIWLSAYFFIVLFSGLFHPETFRVSTIGYQLLFLVMFSLFYNLVYIDKAFSVDRFIKLIRALIIAYSLCLVLQQIVRFIGFTSLPIINLMQGDVRGVMVANSLAIEQSHAARILTVLFLALIRMYEIKLGKDKMKLSTLYVENRWVVIGFLWSMLTMGSGTAYVGLAILSLYFIKNKYILWSIPLLAIFYISIPYLNIEALERAKVTFEAALTLDRSAVLQTDHSAAARVVPIINTINGLDLTDTNTWFGYGVDTNTMGEYLGEDVMIGSIRDYGLLSYLLLLVFIFKFCIKFWSLESLIFLVLLSANLGNVAYGWGIMMIFVVIRYLKDSSITTLLKQNIVNEKYS